MEVLGPVFSMVMARAYQPIVHGERIIDNRKFYKLYVLYFYILHNLHTPPMYLGSLIRNN